MYPVQPRLFLQYKQSKTVIFKFHNSVMEYTASIHRVACFPSLQSLKNPPSPQAEAAQEQQPDEKAEGSGIQILTPAHLSEMEIQN